MPTHRPASSSARSPAVGRYANTFRVGFNAFEVVIEFGEQFSEDSERTHTRIVTNPVSARALLESLSDALEQRAAALANDSTPDDPSGLQTP